MKPKIIGISGKIGSGKNYLADRLTEELYKADYTLDTASFAAPLKAEMGQIVADFSVHVNESDDDIEHSIKALASVYNIPFPQMKTLLSYVKKELKANPQLDGYARSEGIRRGLQFLGTDIRRNQNDRYWVNKFYEQVNLDVDFIFSTDMRFPNEADFVLDEGGVALRLEVPEEVIKERIEKRDGISYSEDAHKHISETALDDYPNFSIIVGETFDASEVLKEALNKFK
jgi:cytidylate kinase